MATRAPLSTWAYELVAEFLDPSTLSALVVGLGPARHILDPVVERSLLRANHAPQLWRHMRVPVDEATLKLHKRCCRGEFDQQTMPKLHARCATPLLEARRLLRASGLLEDPGSSGALGGIYAHGEAYGSAWGAELESSVLLSLPDLRAGRRPSRTLVVVTTGFENGCGPECGCAWSEWTVVEARLSDDAAGAFTTLVMFQRTGRNEYSPNEPWCETVRDVAVPPGLYTYLQTFAAACGVAVAEVGDVVRHLANAGRVRNAWTSLETRYARARLRAAGGGPASSRDDVDPGAEPTAAGDFPNIRFGIRDDVTEKALENARNSCHLEEDVAPRRRLVALCAALPASARRGLGPAVSALRDACARCSWKMPVPEEDSDDEWNDGCDY